MSERRSERLPREVYEVLRDDRELVRLASQVTALADEVATTHGRWRLFRPSAAVTAAAALALAVALALQAGGRGPSLSDRALAALGHERVLHVLVARSAEDDRTVELSTGRQVPARVSVESWFDERTGRLRVVQRRNGSLVADSVGTIGARARKADWRLDPALKQLLTGYRTALRNGLVRDLGRDVVDGHRVRWLGLRSGERIAVDADSHVPLLIERRDGTRWSVVQIRSVRLSGADLRASRSPPTRPSGGAVLRRESGTLSVAARLLGVPALWPGRAFGDLRLASVRLERLLTSYPRGSLRRPFRSHGVVLIYRSSDGARVVELRQARQPLPAYAFNGSLTFYFDPIPREGSMQLARGGSWLGQLRAHGLVLTIAGSDAATVVRVARNLRPIAG